MDTTGLDGHTTTVSAPAMASSTPGPGRACSAPSNRTAGDGHVVAQLDEVLLEPDLGPVDQLEPGAERVVGHRQQADADAEAMRPARR